MSRRRCICDRFLYTRWEWDAMPRDERPANGIAHSSRGLCGRCANRARATGVIEQFPRTHRPSDVTVEEWEHLRQSGVSIHQAAVQLGVTVAAIEKACERVARRRNQQMEKVA